MYVCIYTKDLCLHTLRLRTFPVAWVVISEVTEVHSLDSNQLEILLLLSNPAVKEGWESLLKSFPHLLQVVYRKDPFSLLGLPHPKFHLQRCRHLIPCSSSKSLRMNTGLFIEALLHSHLSETSTEHHWCTLWYIWRVFLQSFFLWPLKYGRKILTGS